ncbi:MAG: PAS domain S-box-containing protein [Natronomonas sp.]|jgi:PAS domain S-box-containing protein
MDEVGPEFFETMVEAVGVGVAIYGADGRYRYVNGAYADLLAVDRSELVGTPVCAVAVDLDPARFDGYWDSFTDGETRTAETEHRHSGRTVPVATVTTRHRIDGTPYNFGTVKDISERKAREREVKRQNERLDSFAGVVAHDLRNPLNVAQNYLELLQDDVDREETALVESALGRMETLIDDLLTLAREGERISETELVSLRETATAAWKSTQSHGADLTVDADATLAADGARLRQLFENLFGNAVEHGSTSPSSQAPEDAVEHGSASRRPAADDTAAHAEGVSVRVGPLAEGFYVADDGPGIPEGRREEVFDPGHSTDDDGTGFGLAIVQEIAEAHGWDIRVTDAEGGGARFEVTGVSRAE